MAAPGPRRRRGAESGGRPRRRWSAGWPWRGWFSARGCPPWRCWRGPRSWPPGCARWPPRRTRRGSAGWRTPRKASSRRGRAGTCCWPRSGGWPTARPPKAWRPGCRTATRLRLLALEQEGAVARRWLAGVVSGEPPRTLADALRLTAAGPGGGAPGGPPGGAAREAADLAGLLEQDNLLAFREALAATGSAPLRAAGEALLGGGEVRHLPALLDWQLARRREALRLQGRLLRLGLACFRAGAPAELVDGLTRALTPGGPARPPEEEPPRGTEREDPGPLLRLIDLQAARAELSTLAGSLAAAGLLPPDGAALCARLVEETGALLRGGAGAGGPVQGGAAGRPRSPSSDRWPRPWPRSAAPRCGRKGSWRRPCAPTTWAARGRCAPWRRPPRRRLPPGPPTPGRCAATWPAWPRCTSRSSGRRGSGGTPPGRRCARWPPAPSAESPRAPPGARSPPASARRAEGAGRPGGRRGAADGETAAAGAAGGDRAPGGGRRPADALLRLEDLPRLAPADLRRVALGAPRADLLAVLDGADGGLVRAVIRSLETGEAIALREELLDYGPIRLERGARRTGAPPPPGAGPGGGRADRPARPRGIGRAASPTSAGSRTSGSGCPGPRWGAAARR